MGGFIEFIKKFDWIILACVGLLSLVGVTEIYSVALGQGSDESMANFSKQTFFLALGVVLLFFCAYFLRYEILKNNAIYVYLFGVLLLVMVLLVGTEVRGTKGWFSLGAFSLQPVEFVKIILLVFLAHYFNLITGDKNKYKYYVISTFGVLVLVFLVLQQPDFGSAFILLATWFFLIIIAGLKKRYIFILVGTAILGIILSWSYYFKPYQKERILTFFNSSENSLDQGYNVTQAVIAVGSGQLYGRGVGFGSQSQLKFLPESQNDFIFAVVAEELGFIGVLFVLVLFFVLMLRLYVNSRKIEDQFGVFFIFGAMILIFIEMFINIGMNLGIVPVVGISLPFISYGGSSMIANLILIGILESIIVRSKISLGSQFNL